MLEYRTDAPITNVEIGLPQFVRNVFHLPGRVLDLLEIASYVLAADRKARRGRLDVVEYHSWSRRLDFRIKVRDAGFWGRAEVKQALSAAIQFMSGDAQVTFSFFPGHDTPPTSLFDRPEFRLDETVVPRSISLFSGGLDSLAGALDLLRANKHAVLVSHQSQTGTKRTQRGLVSALLQEFPRCVSHYEFETHLRGDRAPEETQRTRALLYCSIAFALANAYALDEFFVFENGVTSINLYRREDLANARASRTTHPRTMLLLSKLFSLIQEKPFFIRLPFLRLTKCEVIQKIKSGPVPNLLSSSVSCTRAFRDEGTSHCGTCFQCVDRRIASYAAGADDSDHSGLYGFDIVNSSISDPVARATVIDYIRQAATFEKWGIARLEEEYAYELAQLADTIAEIPSDSEMTDTIFDLMRRHGQNVGIGIRAMRDRHDDPFSPVEENSLLNIVARREHLRPEVERLIETISNVISSAVPEMFRTNRPVDEPDLNQKLGALLRTHEPGLRSEHPSVSFACAKVVPDHVLLGKDLLIESKYIRKGTSPSKASDGIAADVTKYSNDAHVLFVVYDPEHAIASDDIFVSDFERRGHCTIKILR